MATPNDELTTKRTKAGSPGASLYDGKELVSHVVNVNSDNKERRLEYVSVALVILIPVVLTVGVWWFAKFLQVTPDTGMSIFIRVCWVVAAGVLLVKTRLSTIQGISPFILLGLCWSLYPALDYWLYG
jgi:hypothetical protein